MNMIYTIEFYQKLIFMLINSNAVTDTENT